MLYYIDNTVASALQKREFSEDEKWFFTDLAGAYRKGKCYLCGDSASLKKLAENLSDSGSVFYSVLAKHLEHGAVIQAVKTVFVISFSEDGFGVTLPAVLTSPDKAFFIPIEKAIQNEWQIGNNCCLLSENLTDNEFYYLIGKHYCNQHGYGQLQLSFHNENGGGSTTATVFTKCVEEEKRPTLCIIDSDRKHGKTRQFPSDPAIGDTLMHVRDAKNKLDINSRNPPFFLQELFVHEAENLIPMDVLSSIEQVNVRDGKQLLIKLCGIGKEEAILYYDFKKGFPYIIEKPKQQYWKDLLLLLGGKETEMPPDKKPENRDKQDEITQFFPAVGKSDLLEQAVQSMKDNPGFQVDSYLEALWEEIGLIMLTWGCASAVSSV